ncbi:FAD-binding oxidoreductase [Frateuria terrea]|uniref:FAD/FMN-containing dehydrogenase n=1 Tax=Frateuria terrea TaxID=529704 RepID=A0A1H6QRD6_9GAMM|nr:FAD-binding oxidoreductase [Frateuria terrea]SEI46261.1 FAD/FMN-containing dehydrogenase [Frateuria terrea]SFP12115.1 FAD/FMN-containing dehydrogenase [Frateuria terrea]
MTESRLADLTARVPGLRLLTELTDLIHYGRDWTRRWGPAPLAVALPSDAAEVQAIVRWANERQVALVPSGGRTGLSGGAVAARGELVLSLQRMNRVLGFDATDRLLEVEAGITLHAVHEAAREHGLLYPVDFGARGSCTIGGNVATNAGGIRVVRHGTTREWIAGLTVVAGNGELLELNRGLVKNSSGYDLRQLMIGSEGTLGVVVGAQLKLTDPSPPAQTMLLALPHMDALMEVFGLFRSRLKLQAFEFFTDVALKHVLAHGAQRAIDASEPYYVVAEYDALEDRDEQAALLAFEEGVREGWISDGVIAQNEAQAAALWRLREGITESLAPRKPYKNDIALRISAMPAFLHEMQALLARAYPQMEVVWFGHIGDGNLHINVLPPEDMAQAEFLAHCERVTRLLADALQRHGGSISAEHGIGLVKRAYLDSTRSAAEIALMRGVRTVFDPHGILNPGKLFE